MRYDGPVIILNEVVYRTLGRGDGSGKIVTVAGAKYLGVIERRSDGYTVLSLQKTGSTKAFNIEVGALISVRANSRQWKPETNAQRFRLRAAELRSFIERTELEDWAKPYFDPGSAKHHAKRPVTDWAARSADETRILRHEAGEGFADALRRWKDASHNGPHSASETIEPVQKSRPGLLRRLWRFLRGER